MARNYTPEFRARAIRLVEEKIKLENCTSWTVSIELGEKLDIPSHMLYSWLH